MRVSLDTNVWIFGIVGSDRFCERILVYLSQIDVIVPNQVRIELERNLSQKNLKIEVLSPQEFCEEFGL